MEQKIETILEWFLSSKSKLKETTSIRNQINRTFLLSGTFFKYQCLYTHEVRTVSAMGYACMRNNPDIAELLCDIGRRNDVDKPDTRDGNTPLHHTSRVGALAGCRWLISKGVNLNIENNYKSTPLMESCWLGHTGIAELIIAASTQAPRLYIPFCRAFQSIHHKSNPIATCTWLIRKGAIDHSLNTSQILYIFPPSKNQLPVFNYRKSKLLSWARLCLRDALAFRLAQKGMSFVPESLISIIASYIGKDVIDSTSLRNIRVFVQVIYDHI